MRSKAQPTRRLIPQSAAMPAYGPEVPGCNPHLLPSIHCSWCGTETIERSDIKLCPVCDLAPAKTP